MISRQNKKTCEIRNPLLDIILPGGALLLADTAGPERNAETVGVVAAGLGATYAKQQCVANDTSFWCFIGFCRCVLLPLV